MHKLPLILSSLNGEAVGVLAEADLVEDGVDLLEAFLGLHEVLVQPGYEVLLKLTFRLGTSALDSLPVLGKLGARVPVEQFHMLRRLIFVYS